VKAQISMRQALVDMDLFGAILPGESWRPWRILLIAAMGEPLLDDERDTFKALTGCEREPLERVDELWCVIGRRGGKTRAVAVLAAFIAALVDWSDILAPGERASLPIMSASVWQAAKAKQYLDGIFSSVPAFSKLVENTTADTISLSTRVDIEVRPASFRTSRGGTSVAAIADEVAFWRSDNAANPDVEILNAIRPSLATTGGMLACISSPYARRGELYTTWKKHWGPGGDSGILVAKAASRVMNPSLSEAVVARAYERDAVAARAEYGGEFRTDIEAFVSREVVEARVSPGCFERPRVHGVIYSGFVDPSGGSADDMTLAIAHREGGVMILDCIRAVRPPFSPEAVVAEFAVTLRAYGVAKIAGDRYAGEWPREQFRKVGVEFECAEKPKSDLYRDLLPLLNSGKVDLLDDGKLVSQLCGLERRTARGGRDSVDHAAGAHDDVANAVAGALLRAQAEAGSLAALEDYLLDGEAIIDPGFPRMVVASIICGQRGEHLGMGAASIYAFRPARWTGAILVLIDVVTAPFGATFLAETFRRSQLWSEQLQPHMGHVAFAEPEVAEAYNRVVVDVVSRDIREGRSDHLAQTCRTFPAELLARGDLAASAAALVQNGLVKIGATILDEATRRPIGAMLDMRAGDEDDPAKRSVALMIVGGVEREECTPV
jgi:hypothetical protein